MKGQINPRGFRKREKKKEKKDEREDAWFFPKTLIQKINSVKNFSFAVKVFVTDLSLNLPTRVSFI